MWSHGVFFAWSQTPSVGCSTGLDYAPAGFKIPKFEDVSKAFRKARLIPTDVQYFETRTCCTSQCLSVDTKDYEASDPSEFMCSKILCLF